MHFASFDSLTLLLQSLTPLVVGSGTTRPEISSVAASSEVVAAHRFTVWINQRTHPRISSCFVPKISHAWDYLQVFCHSRSQHNFSSARILAEVYAERFTSISRTDKWPWNS